MKTKGFTLIELLAVIVILAIIALIATPIILGIISDARTQARKRSAELVYKGVEYAYTQTILTSANGTDFTLTDLNNKLKIENVTSTTVNGDTLEIVTKDGVYCGVTKNTSTNSIDVVCGTDDEDFTQDDVMETKSIVYSSSSAQSGETQDFSFRPQYYKANTETLSVGDVLVNGSTTAPVDTNQYFGYDLDGNNQITAMYACLGFIDSETSEHKEFCVKALDSEAFGTYDGISSTSVYDVSDKNPTGNFKVLSNLQTLYGANCTYHDGGCSCEYMDFRIGTSESGTADTVNSSAWSCYIWASGQSQCYSVD